jgi:hypothetical protein
MEKDFETLLQDLRMKFDYWPIVKLLFKITFCVIFTVMCWIGESTEHSYVVFLSVFIITYILIDWWYGLMDATYHFGHLYFDEDENITTR